MNKRVILAKTRSYVKKEMEGEASGHDWYHVERVTRLALRIGKKEKADLFITEMGALLHDIADHKFHGGDLEAGPRATKRFLMPLKADKEAIEAICHIVRNVSFKGAKVKSEMKSKEGKVVQDADKLDALGAIGIARCFAYGGNVGSAMYDPKGKINHHTSFEEYKRKGSASQIHHFYDKLFLLKDMMHTRTAKEIARQRHAFMKRYVREFFLEWEGKR